MSYKLEIIHKQGKFETTVEDKDSVLKSITECLRLKLNYQVNDKYNSTVIPYRLLRKSVISITDKAKYENVTKPEPPKASPVQKGGY